MAERKMSEWELKWEHLVADAWDDPALKQRLLQDPMTVFKERGLALPAGVQVQVHEATATTWQMILPPKPGEGELSEKYLDAIAGGHCRGCGGCRID
jgi:hypothetical protein